MKAVFIFFTPLPSTLTRVCLYDYLAFCRKTHHFSRSQELPFLLVCEDGLKYFLIALFIFADLSITCIYVILYSNTRGHHHFSILQFPSYTQHFHCCSKCIPRLFFLFQVLLEFGNFLLVLGHLGRNPRFTS